MNIDTMEAGNDMDMLIAEKVMGWTELHLHRFGQAGTFLVGDHDGKELCQVPHYSTDIAAAWQVVDKMCIHTIRRVINYAPDSPALWSAEIYYDDPGIGETVQLAICRVALKAAEILGEQ